MIVVGLTGSIGMGKSTAADMLREMGVPVHDSDATVHEIMSPGGRAIADVAKHFPEAYKADGSIDRPALGRIVFADDQKRRVLEGILHPLVWESQAAFKKEMEAKGHPVVVLDIPLLYETGAEQRVDKVIVVSAPAFIQKKRVMARPGMTEERLKGILALQVPDHEKRARADYVVNTGIGKAFTQRALRKIIETMTHEKTRHNFPPYAR
jgi:dephospho-CoA kinase